jgi:hypothetical protein
MVGVVVGEDHMRDRLVRNLGDRRQQAPRQRGRAQRVDQHHALRRDDESGVGDEILIGAAAQRGQALHVPGRGRDLHRRHGALLRHGAGGKTHRAGEQAAAQ